VKDFVPVLQKLVEEQAVGMALRASHRPCRRLITFPDFCQEVLVRALEHRASFRGETKAELLAWLKAIGQQLLVNTLRKSRRGELFPLSREPEDPALPPVEQTEVEEEQRRKGVWLLEMMGSLSADESDILFRHYFRRQKLKEIAKDLGLSPNTLAQRHARLLRRLREQRDR
jgi:RNA polymerase sigma factor (sigma-70 family)